MNPRGAGAEFDFLGQNMSWFSSFRTLGSQASQNSTNTRLNGEKSHINLELIWLWWILYWFMNLLQLKHDNTLLLTFDESFLSMCVLWGSSYSVMPLCEPSESTSLSSTVYESTGLVFPDSQRIRAASGQLQHSFCLITGGEGTRSKRHQGQLAFSNI